MAKPKRTKSGKWSVKVYAYQDADGKQHYKRITADTKAQCEFLAAQFRQGERRPAEDPQITVGEVVDQYIDLCKVLSPTTVAGYQKIRRTGFQDLMQVRVVELDEKVLQEAVNREASRMGRRGRISPKTVGNEWGLISSALWHISRRKYEIRLPRRARTFKDYPEPKVIMDLVEGTEIELPCLLALWLSFSMSEIRGLQFNDVKDGFICIKRVMVDVDGKPTVKPNAKTETRNRRHRLPGYLQQLIDQADHSQPYIVPLNQRQINGRFQRLCRQQGINMTFHDLRHLNASVMLMLNIPEKYAMERGGWKTPNVMKSVYQHTFTEERIAVDDKMDSYFETLKNRTIQQDSSGQTH